MSQHYHPLLGLYLARLREFYRQPARIFWVYGFPTLLALGLGLAFQGRGPEGVQVDLVRNGDSAGTERTLRAHDVGTMSKSPGNPTRIGVRLKVSDEPEALRRLRTGKTPLVVVPGPAGGVTYRFDP